MRTSFDCDGNSYYANKDARSCQTHHSRQCDSARACYSMSKCCPHASEASAVLHATPQLTCSRLMPPINRVAASPGKPKIVWPDPATDSPGRRDEGAILIQARLLLGQRCKRSPSRVGRATASSALGLAQRIAHQAQSEKLL